MKSLQETKGYKKGMNLFVVASHLLRVSGIPLDNKGGTIQFTPKRKPSAVLFSSKSKKFSRPCNREQERIAQYLILYFF